MIREANDRRWKLAYISAIDVMGLFLPWGQQGERFTQVFFDPEDVPDGYAIDDIRYCDVAQAWRLTIHHPSFDIVPPGQMIPPVRKLAEAFYLPKCRSLAEARAVANWHRKSETDRLREMLADLELEGPSGAKPDA